MWQQIGKNMKKMLACCIIFFFIFLTSAQLPESYSSLQSTNQPSILNSTQLNQLSAAQKKLSDELIKNLLINLAQIEFYSLPSMQKFILEELKNLQENQLFFQRAALDTLLDEQEGLFAQLQTLYTPKANQNLNQFLLQSYVELQRKENSIFYTTLRNVFRDCFFDANELNNEPIIAAFLQLCTSAIITQRQKASNISAAQAKKSDAVFMNVFKKYQKNLESGQVTGLQELGYELNRLRLLPSFLKFTEYMLYPIEKNVLQGEAIIPLIPFVRNITQFLPVKTSFAASQQLDIQTRRFLFDKSLWRATINNEAWKPAFEYEFARNRPITPKISLQNFVLQELPKIKSLTQLNRLFKQLQDNYSTELQPYFDTFTTIQNTILTQQTKIKSQEIINFVSNITQQQVPTEFATFLGTIQNDLALLNLIQNVFAESETTKQDFGKLLLEKTTQYPALQKELVNLYRTPHSLFLAIQNTFKNREMKYNLDEQQFYFKTKPSGMLIRVLEFFIREVDKNAALAKNNWQMLRQSLECMNNPQLCLANDGKYFNIYQTTYNALYPKDKVKSAIQERIEQGKAATLQLAPELFNFYIENNSLKPFAFIPSLTAYKDAEYPNKWGIYDKKLDNLLDALQSKNTEQISAQVRELVKQAEIIPVDKEPFVTFIKNLKKALLTTLNQLPP